MLTEKQIIWAKSHDWFIAAHADGTIVIRELYGQLQADVAVVFGEDTIHWTQGFKALRDWAGY